MMKVEGAQALTYGEAQGYRGLRELVCHKYDLFEGLKVEPDNIVVANGSGHALSLAFSAFVDVGDPIICEAPTFSGTLNTIRRHGARVLDAPVDAEGMVTSVVRQRLEQLRARRAPLQADLHDRQLPEPVRPDDVRCGAASELVELAQEFDTLILEDDAYGELRFEGEAQPSLYSLDPTAA